MSVIGQSFSDKLVEMIVEIVNPERSMAAIIGKDIPKNIKNKFINAIRNVGNRAYIALLVPLLTNEDPWLRSSAASRLEGIGDRTVANHLISLLKDSNYHVRFRGANALNKLKWRPKSGEEKHNYQNHRAFHLYPP